jgi:hypothetical protein
MVQSVWEVFLALFGRGEGTDEDSDEEDDGGRFVPSPLDLSVRIGHGGSDSQQVRELSKVSERARELEDQRRSE